MFIPLPRKRFMAPFGDTGGSTVSYDNHFGIINII